MKKNEDVAGYLGMRKTIREDEIYLDTDTYAIEVLDEFSTGGSAPVPANEAI